MSGEMNKTEQKAHVFAICAYQESPYLEECILSILKQSVKTNVFIATATPNPHIQKLSEKYQIPVYVNRGEHGITQDWNFAAGCGDYDYVTIAHQDDVYHKDYVKNLRGYLKKTTKPLIFFTDYAEIRDSRITEKNRNLTIKRMMLLPLRFRMFWGSRWVRRRILSFGNPICCPSVTFATANLPDPLFENHYQAAEDWEAWERYSKLQGEFVFCSKILTYHRIHEDSETTKLIHDSSRGKEDREMFGKFWPAPIADLLAKLYGSSEKSNRLN